MPRHYILRNLSAPPDKKWKGTGKQTVTCSYNVLEYASDPHEAYTRKYGGRTTGRALVVGMNPGPWGMVRVAVYR